MFEKKYYLKDLDERFRYSDAYFVSYRIENNSDYQDSYYERPGMVVIPGGAYAFTSDREGEPVALAYAIEGFNTFVLKYTVKEKYPAPHNELAFTLNYINTHNKEFMVKKNKVSIVGFSAGGHLVTSYGYTYKEQAKELNLDENMIRPYAIVAGYPVTKAYGATHLDTIKNITGSDSSLYKKMDVPSNISESYPPTYIFSTVCDEAVPIVNSYKLLDALKKSNVINDSIFFEKGVHGGSLYTRGINHGTNEIADIKENYVWLHKSANFIFDLLKE